KCVYAHIERISHGLDRVKAGNNILRPPNIERRDIEANRTGTGLYRAPLQYGIGIIEVCHNRQAMEIGDSLAKKFYSFAGEIGGLQRQPGDLPPGCAKLATRPLPTGSSAIAKTMGMADVARTSAGTLVPFVTITSTFRCTSSAAKAATRSAWPSDQRYSMAMLRPSIQPNSPRRRVKAGVHVPHIATLGPKTTIVGTLPGCCARVASGHAAAVPPINEMNSRRLIASPEAYDH